MVRGTTSDPRLPPEPSAGWWGSTSYLRMLSPPLVPEFVDMCVECREAGIRVDFVATDEVLQSYTENYSDVLEAHLDEGTLSVWAADDLKLGLCVSDRFTSLNLHRDDGTFGLDNMFLAESEEAIEWGIGCSNGTARTPRGWTRTRFEERVFSPCT